MEVIVHSLEPVLLVGGGSVDQADLGLALTFATQCVVADGGLTAAIKAGITPVAVIGDLDSANPAELSKISDDTVHHVTEQNSTDFDKALRNIAAPVVVAVGFSGGRTDHALAAFHTLVKHNDRPCVMICAEDIVFHCPRRIGLSMAADELVSLFPMAAVTGRSTGLHWPIDGLDFAPDLFVGTSNRSTGAIELHMDNAGMLCILGRQHLSAVIKALESAVPHAQCGVRGE